MLVFTINHRLAAHFAPCPQGYFISCFGNWERGCKAGLDDSTWQTGRHCQSDHISPSVERHGWTRTRPTEDKPLRGQEGTRLAENTAPPVLAQ